MIIYTNEILIQKVKVPYLIIELNENALALTHLPHPKQRPYIIQQYINSGVETPYKEL